MEPMQIPMTKVTTAHLQLLALGLSLLDCWVSISLLAIRCESAPF